MDSQPVGNVYGELPNVDFVHRLTEIAEKQPGGNISSRSSIHRVNCGLPRFLIISLTLSGCMTQRWVRVIAGLCMTLCVISPIRVFIVRRPR